MLRKLPVGVRFTELGHRFIGSVESDLENEERETIIERIWQMVDEATNNKYKGYKVREVNCQCLNFYARGKDLGRFKQTGTAGNLEDEDPDSR